MATSADTARVLWFSGENPEENQEPISTLTAIEPASSWEESDELVETIYRLGEVSDRLRIDRPDSSIEEPGGFFSGLREWLEQFRPDWADWQSA